MLLQAKHIFFVGIKGVAMANLARIFIQQGVTVSGSDTTEEFITDNGLGDVTILALDADLPSDTDLVVFSAAHGGMKSKQVQEAQQKNITVMHQASLLSQLIKDFQTSVAVAGCHGKTTTSALLSYTLKNLNADPSYMVGVSDFSGNETSLRSRLVGRSNLSEIAASSSTPRNDYHQGGHYGSKDYFVIEADEYALDPPADKTPKFHLLHPTHAIITNIDFDHPDVYDNIQSVKEAFETFIENVLKSEVRSEKLEKTPRIILCLDDPILDEISKTIPKAKHITYGFDSRADVRIEHVQSTENETTFTLIYKLQKHSFTVNLFGDKNVLNAAAVIAYLLSQWFSVQDVVSSIKGFTGAKRRFEQVAYLNDTYLFDDYAHHPHEIEATIQAARSRFPKRRVVVIFQPHTYSRTESLKTEFVTALNRADKALVAPIFASAREKQDSNAITSVQLAELASQNTKDQLTGYNTSDDLIEGLRQTIKKGDVIFTMGAGDIYHMKNTITSIMETL